MQRCGGNKIDAIGTEWVREYLTYNGNSFDIIGTEWEREYLTYSSAAVQQCGGCGSDKILIDADIDHGARIIIDV